ncbi:hypothetical protein [Gryllotalpicola koreensis]|uniref:Lipoprotein n=1 Tax=Gryllotalpicola koreensis TaxID=993086 RepID=A0ABP7ZR53_9MICO
MRRIAWVIAAAAVLVLGGCAGDAAPRATSATTASPSPSPLATPANVAVVPQDTTAFGIMKKVAPEAARLSSGASVSTTSCWTPSEHLFTDPTVAPPTVFRVICRVFYSLDAAQRYTDVVCIGDFAKTPMLDHCYIWKPHLGDPGFGDGPALASAPPTPLP